MPPVQQQRRELQLSKLCVQFLWAISTRESDEDSAQCWERALMAPKLSCVTEEGYINYHESKPISERNNLPWEAGTLYLAPAEHLD